MPRRSAGSESGGVEMRDVDPNVDLASAYEKRPSTVDGRNDMHAGGAHPPAGRLGGPGGAMVAAAKDDGRSSV